MAKFVACQDNKVIGFADTLEEAENLIKEEQERDKFWLFFHRSLLKKLLKSKKPLKYKDSIYFIAEVKNEVPFPS